jgi:hypothetical protein
MAAMGCFNGDVSQCQMNRDHDQDVKAWKDRGIQIVLGAGAFFILGASLFAGSLGRRKDAELSDGPDVPLTEEEAEKLARLERDAALMGSHP